MFKVCPDGFLCCECVDAYVKRKMEVGGGRGGILILILILILMHAMEMQYDNRCRSFLLALYECLAGNFGCLTCYRLQQPPCSATQSTIVCSVLLCNQFDVMGEIFPDFAKAARETSPALLRLPTTQGSFTWIATNTQVRHAFCPCLRDQTFSPVSHSDKKTKYSAEP